MTSLHGEFGQKRACYSLPINAGGGIGRHLTAHGGLPERVLRELCVTGSLILVAKAGNSGHCL